MALTIEATDGYPLGATLTEAANPQALVVITGATGVPHRFYARFARWLADRGAHVLTFDYRGIAASRPERLRGFTGTLSDWGAKDLEGVMQWARRTHPGLPVRIVGHSVGGQILGLAASNAQADRIVTVASQSGYWQLWPWQTRLVMGTLWHALMPLVPRVVGYVPGQLGIGEDLPEHVAREWARWGRSPNYLLDHTPAREGFARITAPVTSWSFSDDFYAPQAAVDWLHAQMTAAPVRRVHLTPRDLSVKAIGHFAAFRDSFSNTLWPAFAEALGLEHPRHAERAQH